MKWSWIWLPCLVWHSAAAPVANEAEGFHRLLDSFPIVAEIDAAVVAPEQEFPPGSSRTTNILGQAARILPPGEEAKAMTWVIGAKASLKPGAAYVLSVEFPDDIPRSIFIANRGADQVRGVATGTATGDVRRQYTQPSLESVAYPQTAQWQRYRSLFVLHHRFQGVKAQRDPVPGGRPYLPTNGFHVVIFQSRKINDPRSEGAAVGRIRLHAVPSLDLLAAGGSELPSGLPRRHVFFREEMGDEPVSGKASEDRACDDPIDWFVWKAGVARAMGYNTFAKDLLEFGHNQGWDSGDQNWIINAQPPLKDAWERMLPRIAELGFEFLPYYEYKGGLGWREAKPPSLAWQRRAEKLYHGQPNTNYTGVWWVEQHNSDLTDPDTLKDAKRLLDVTILKHARQARFVGAWFRMRGNHLPISFAQAALDRFSMARMPNLKTGPAELIRSYEGDQKLYNDYIDWWLGRRAEFLRRLQEHLSSGLNQGESRPFGVLFTAWPSEPVPLLRDPGTGQAGHPVQITTSDPEWWAAFARQQEGTWFRWAYAPMSYEDVINNDLYSKSLEFRERISPLPWRTEDFHAAPGADPSRYRDIPGVALTYPIGRLFTVARSDQLERFRAKSGLTVIHHFPLNEDNPKDKGFQGPFDGNAGYTCVDVDRAGGMVRLMEARAVAHGDPVNIGYLMASAFSSGFPGYVRQFNRAYLAVPALPSEVAPGPDPNVVVRRLRTPADGMYFYIVNTSMQHKSVEINMPAGNLKDLITDTETTQRPLRLDLYPGELRSYHLKQ